MKRLLSLLLVAGCASAPPPPRTADATQAFRLRTEARQALAGNDPRTCVRLFEEARKLAPETSGEAYDRGCCHARAGETHAAFEALNHAVDLGEHDGEHLQVDADLSILHEDPRWQTLVTKIAAAQEAYLGSVNRELHTLYRADQKDRSEEEVDWSAVSLRDTARRSRVKEIVAANGARVSDDWFHAAMIYQHGSTVEDFQTAHAYAMKAAELVPTHPKARWLAAAAKDREHMTKGIPQLYGTQFQNTDGQWVLYTVDPTVTDEERAKWNVPPIAQARERAKAMNERATRR